MLFIKSPMTRYPSEDKLIKNLGCISIRDVISTEILSINHTFRSRYREIDDQFV